MSMSGCGNLDPGDLFLPFIMPLLKHTIHLIWIAMFPNPAVPCQQPMGEVTQVLWILRCRPREWWNHDGKNAGTMMEPAKLVFSDWF